MPNLLNTIAECLSLHAQSIDRLGTDRPELDPRIEDGFRERMIRQRKNVAASLEGDPEQHRRHVESLNSALRIMLRRLASQPPKPAPPPLPTWDDQAKRWVVGKVPTTGKARLEELARQFDEPGPDDPNELFHNEET